MIRRLRQLHADQSGFTLPELISAMVVGLIVLMAAFMLLDHATSVSNEISDRQDAVQRGRRAMETITRTLRSQVCLGETTEPITAGNDNGVTFYANLTTNTDTAQRRMIAYDPATGKITENIYDGTGTYPDLVFPTTPTSQRLLLESVGQMKEGAVTQPIFRFFTFKIGGAPGDLELLPVPLSSTDVSRVVMVKVAFFAKPINKAVVKNRDATSLQSDIYVRLADPTRPTEGPRCL
jgi:prepilin-type N-terminal cleavage/methylation domain-containing protein